MRLGIFLLPNNEFKRQITKWKKRIEEKIPNQPYTAHPPHLTLITLDVGDKEKSIAAISSLSKSINSFQLIIDKTDIFWNDMVTNGHTLFYGIEKNKSLFTLQKMVADSLLEFKNNNPKMNFNTENEEFRKSYNKYGFPFIGDHWIPHFSISSIHSQSTHSIIDEFLSLDIRFSFIIDKITIWEINSNQHKKLKELSLL